MRTRLWIPEQHTTHECPTITIPVGTISGHYHIELLDKKDVVLNTWSFDNIITDTGMDAIGSQISGEVAELFNFIQAGAGSTTPSGTDVNLVSPITGRIGYSTATGSLINTDASGSFYTRQLTYLLDETRANGNVTELGIFTLSAGGRLINRALVRDGLGVPTTITKTADNQLRVLYTYKVYVPTTDITGSITLGVTSYDYVIRPQTLSGSNGWGTSPEISGPTRAGGYTYEITQRNWGGSGGSTRFFYLCSPSGTLLQPTASLNLSPFDYASSVSVLAYVNGNRYVDMDAIWEPDVGNFGSTGIHMFAFRGIGTNGNAAPTAWTHQMQFTPNISKVNTQRLTLRFRFGWTRARTSE